MPSIYFDYIFSQTETADKNILGYSQTKLSQNTIRRYI